MGFEDEARLDTIAQSGALVTIYAAAQAPVKLVNASVLNGTMLVEVSSDLFVADVRRVTSLAAGATNVAFDEFRYYVAKNHRVRITTTGAGAAAHLRQTVPGLTLIP